MKQKNMIAIVTLTILLSTTMAFADDIVVESKIVKVTMAMHVFLFHFFHHPWLKRVLNHQSLRELMAGLLHLQALLMLKLYIRTLLEQLLHEFLLNRKSISKTNICTYLLYYLINCLFLKKGCNIAEYFYYS